MSLIYVSVGICMLGGVEGESKALLIRLTTAGCPTIQGHLIY